MQLADMLHLKRSFWRLESARSHHMLVVVQQNMLPFENTKKQGNAGLGKAIAYYSCQGRSVSVPLTDDQEYDLIVDISGSLKKVQVKTSRHKKGSIYQVVLKTSGWSKGTFVRKFAKEKVDIVFVATDDGSQYEIPSQEIDAKSSLNMGIKYQKYKVE